MIERGRKIIIAVFFICVLLILILVPISFSYLDYYEYGFKKQSSTGHVDTSYVYEKGRYFFGPVSKLKTFKATAHGIFFPKIAIFTSDNLEVQITVELQYFLIKEDLRLLHESFDIHYESIIENNAKDALKNSVTKFSTEEFISNRTNIQNDLYNGVRQRLSGKCCIPGCKKNCDTCKRWEKCDLNCKPRETCTTEDKGFFAEVRYLQLHGIETSSLVVERKLQVLITKLEKEREEYIKEEKLIRKETELQVAVIKKNASELIRKAYIEADKIIETSQIEAEEIIQTVHINGLANMTIELGITDSKQKVSLIYLQKLKNHEKIKYSIDFNAAIQGKT